MNSNPRSAILGASEVLQQDRPGLARLLSSTETPSASTTSVSPVSHGRSLLRTDIHASRPQGASSGRTVNHSEGVPGASNVIGNEIVIKTEPTDSLESWLDSIGMSAYVDIFTTNKITELSQLHCLDPPDQAEMLAHLKIGEAHQKIILDALQDSVGMMCDSQASTVSGVSHTTDSTTGRSHYLQFSRFKFKRVKSFKVTDE